MAGRPKQTKKKEEVEYVRSAVRSLLEAGATNNFLAAMAGVNEGNISRFRNGRQTLSDEAIENLYESGEISRPTEGDLALHVVHQREKAQPREGWDGEVKTTSEAAYEKGVSPATIRRWCHEGRLNFSRNGERGKMKIWIDEKYEKAESGRRVCRELADARRIIREQDAEIERLRSLRSENERLRSENERLRFETENLRAKNEDLGEEYDVLPTPVHREYWSGD